MLRREAVWVGSWIVGTSATAMAHPGHDGVGNSLMSGGLHPWMGWDHLLAMVVVGLLAMQAGGRRRFGVPACFLLALALGMAWGWQAVGGGWLEACLAATVLGGGICLWASRTLPFAALVAAVSIGGFLHGYAHGCEVPNWSNPASYVTGVVAGSVLLHLVGIGAGMLAAHRSSAATVWRWVGAAVTTVGVWLLIGWL